MHIDRRSPRIHPAPRNKANRPVLESLEDRLLLYSTTGGLWSYNERITYSLIPDGTNVGGRSSSLFSTMNSKFSTATWQAQIQKAAAVWQAVSNINLVMVPDNGAAIGTSGNQQGDSRFGDIRIGAISQSSSILGFAYLPPPYNGGTTAGDIFLNSAQSWQINSDYDLLTVAIHEFGHSLGMDHASIYSADMYAYYTGMKQSLTYDDTAGIQSVYGTRTADAFDASAANNTFATATNITPFLDSGAKIAIPNLDITTTTDYDWFKVTVPETTSGTMTVKMQSANLSSLSPRVQVYNSSIGNRGFSSKPNTYGDTASVTIYGVSAGQTYYIRATNANTGATATGGYGLLVNLGTGSQSPIPPPYTTVASAPDMGGGGSPEQTGEGESDAHDTHIIQVGDLSGWGDSFQVGEGDFGNDRPGGGKVVVLNTAEHGVLLPPPVDLALAGLMSESSDLFGRPRKRP